MQSAEFKEICKEAASDQTSLARHTPRSGGKRGLVTACTASCSATRSCRVQSDSVILSHDVTSLHAAKAR